MGDFNILPAPHFEKEKEITQEERDELMAFNTQRYWWCWYNPDTKVLYNEYCRRILDDAFEYLLGIQMIDENSNRLRGFED